MRMMTGPPLPVPPSAPRKKVVDTVTQRFAIATSDSRRFVTIETSHDMERMPISAHGEQHVPGRLRPVENDREDSDGHEEDDMRDRSGRGRSRERIEALN